MPAFRYRGRNRTGQMLTGEMHGETSAAVATQLTSAGITPIEILQGEVAAPASTLQLQKLFGGGASTEDLMLFSRQMAALMKAGIPIVRALRSLAESSRKPVMKRVLQDVIETLGAGRDLAGAFSRHPEIFPPLFINMVRVGEGSGRLDESFQRLYAYLNFEKYTPDKVRSALRYPAMVIIAVAVAMGVIMVSVVPQFARIFKSFGSDLPVPTQVIIAVSNFTAANWPLILLVIVAIGILVRRFVRTEGGRYGWDRLKLKLPVVGSIVLRGTLARFSRAFTMAFRSGMPLLESLSLISRAVNNEFIGRKIRQMRDSVERGEVLSRAATSTQMFTPLVIQMITVGEETGKLDEMLEEAAEYYEKDVQADVDNLGALLEPILISIVGGLVLVLALGVFLPMWDLAGAAMARR